MNQQNEAIIAALEDFAVTTELLLNQLSISDEENSLEAISILITEGKQHFDTDSTTLQQFLPIWKSIENEIHQTDLQAALTATKNWQRQLQSFLSDLQNTQ